MSGDEWRVRRGRLEEIDAVLALERTVKEVPHWSRVDYAAIFAPVAGDDGSVRRALFTAWTGDDLLGFAVGSLRGDAGGRWSGASDLPGLFWGELESVVVEGVARRRGVGRALCAAVVAWCGEGGAARIELDVRGGSGGAQALYRELGFAEVGRRRGYYSDPVDDAMAMLLPLGADVL